VTENPSSDREPVPDLNQPGNNKRALVQSLRYAQIGFVLPCSVIAGWLLGALVDKWLGSHWIYLLGLGFGIFVGFFDIIRTIRKMGREV
jgi:F0F1-type ATP synthase assembly protein I